MNNDPYSEHRAAIREFFEEKGFDPRIEDQKSPKTGSSRQFTIRFKDHGDSHVFQIEYQNDQDIETLVQQVSWEFEQHEHRRDDL